MSKQMLEAAQGYLSRGWHIIPLNTRSKVPAVASVKEYRTRYPTNEELQNWFTIHNYNVAILTGSCNNLFVVDIDDKDKIETYVDTYSTDLAATTPKGGRHLFYSYSGSDLSISAGTLGVGVDTRGEGGYVVAAPSIVEYADGPMAGKSGGYTWINSGEPAPLPAEIASKLPRAGVTTIQETSHNVDGRATFVHVMMHGFTKGQHNQQVKEAAGYLARTGHSDKDIAAILSPANERDKTPLPERELLSTIASTAGYWRSRNGGKPSSNGATHDRALDNADNPYDMLPVSDAIATYEDYKINWLIEDWLPENSILGLIGAPGQYKTWVLIEAAVQVALGCKAKPFLSESQASDAARPVLIYQQEDYIAEVVKRIRGILFSKMLNKTTLKVYNNTIEIANNPLGAPLHMHTKNNLSFDNLDSMYALENHIKELGAKLVVIDPFYMLEKMDDKYFAGAAKGGIAELKRLRNTYGCSFVIAHHTKKATTNSREDMLGSQLLNGAFEGQWRIAGNEQLNITRTGKFFKGDKTFGLGFAIEETGTEISYRSFLAEPNSTGGKYDEQVMDLLESTNDFYSPSVISKELNLHQTEVSRSIDRLVEAGQALEIQKGKRKLYTSFNNDTIKGF